MGQILYHLFLFFYPVGIRLASLWNEKAQKWLQGRKNWRLKLQDQIDPTATYIWMHCASLGEFEQGRPVLEAIRQQAPQQKIVLTFFSPSGYEAQKDYQGADIICYLPMDNATNAKVFIDLIRPSFVIFVKYEFWHFYLKTLAKQKIPTILISGIFRPNQLFFKSYGSFYKNMLKSFTYFFLQNNASSELLTSIGLNNHTICGDTRFDRVITIANSFAPIQTIEAFIQDNTTIVAGSTWTEDDEELSHFANTNLAIKFIIAPHDITSDRIEACLSLYKNSIKYSDWLKSNLTTENTNVLIIDNIGMLSKLYKYGTICYVGGAFGDDGVHNVLEAAVYYKPVVFGPVYDKYIEAKELEEAQGGFSIDNALELEELFNKLLTDQALYNRAAKNAGDYVGSKTGATPIIMNYINQTLQAQKKHQLGAFVFSIFN